MSMSNSFGSDDAAKYVDARLLFFLKHNILWIAQGFLALKMFRNQTYAHDVKEQNAGKDKENI